MLMFVEKLFGISLNESLCNIYVSSPTQTLACMVGSLFVIIVDDLITTKLFPSHLSDRVDRCRRGAVQRRSSVPYYRCFNLLPERNGGHFCWRHLCSSIKKIILKHTWFSGRHINHSWRQVSLASDASWSWGGSVFTPAALLFWKSPKSLQHISPSRISRPCFVKDTGATQSGASSGLTSWLWVFISPQFEMLIANMLLQTGKRKERLEHLLLRECFLLARLKWNVVFSINVVLKAGITMDGALWLSN